MLELNDNIPSLIKYMGSKTEIIQYVINGMNDIHRENQVVCDLFAGSATLSGAIRGNNIKIFSNDIQKYSEILAKTYLNKYKWSEYPDIMDIINEVEDIVREWENLFEDYYKCYDYYMEFDLVLFKKIEQDQQNIKDDEKFQNIIDNCDSESIKKYHLFTKNYSGTFWSFVQCVWIDSLRCVIDRYKYIPEFHNLLLSCTMYSMAYNSQSTGHYAQFRKANTEKSMNDILIYRRKKITNFFIKKYNEIMRDILHDEGDYCTTTLNDDECIALLPKGTLVYADPPYCSVHYSRFYHILETFVKYDYPVIKYDGRYRDDRFQSPYCILSKVRNAFKIMFSDLKSKDCELVLSYSNSSTTMINLETLLIDCYSIFNSVDSEIVCNFTEEIKSNINDSANYDLNEININITYILDKKLKIISSYDIILKMFQHKHSRLGRTETKSIDVFETLILAKKRG
ncbi:DNA adenine methylase [Clostridium gasigenes]|uniref:DNA adenine methylase n=1 Tax=Clostridium gasigenes TaxID=94869 RepID=UPI001C0E0E3E|nr:DNA adenine methylase [Clostridium gasigenes]MBU3090188.1 DNA adenine methylase [Clostridium gasigenes]